MTVETMNAGADAPVAGREPLAGAALQPPHEPALTRLRWAAKDAIVITRRGLQRIRHEPMQLSDVTFQPVIFVLLFAYVFGSAISIGQGNNYREFLVAGLFGMIIAQTAPGTTVGLSTDMNTGVIDRFRSLPMSRSAVLVGRTLSDLCTNMLAVVVVGVTGYAVGWSINGSALDALAAVGLLLLFALAMSWAGACLGMVMKNVEAAQATAFMIFLPLTFISNAFVPTDHMPPFLRAIANWNPISAIAAACRDLFGNPNPSARIDVWPMQHPVLASLLWSLLFLAIFAPLGVRLYRRRAAV
jgi:ABC-2 type transport system permease protein